MAAPLETRVRITGDASGAVAAIARVRGELGALQSLSAKAFAIGGAIGATGAVGMTGSVGLYGLTVLRTFGCGAAVFFM